MAKQKAIEPHEVRKILRQAIRDSGKTVYRLHVETEIDQGQLHKFLNDENTDMRASSIERLCLVLNLKLVKDDSAD